jgi:hypothetical protein
MNEQYCFGRSSPYNLRVNPRSLQPLPPARTIDQKSRVLSMLISKSYRMYCFL